MNRAPSILEAVDDRNLLGATIEDPAAWRPWRALLAAAFGLPMDDDALALYRACTGRAEAPCTPFSFLWLIIGRRGGKSSTMAILAVYLAIFRDWRPYLRRGERAIILLVAQDRDQARIIRRYVEGILDAPLLSGKVLRIADDEIELTWQVTIEVVTRNYRTVRGRSVCCAVLDELAVWRAEDSTNPDTEVFNAAMATFGRAAMMIAGSSPYSRRGVLWEAWRNWHGSENANNLVWQAATRTMNPSVSQEFIDSEYERDEANARAEYGAEFRSDLETFLPWELISAAVDKGRLELSYVPGRQYGAFVDAAAGGPDDYCIAIAHREGERFVIDLVRSAPRPVHPHNATVQFAHLCRQYRIDRVTGDAYGGQWVQGAWKSQGIGYDVSDMNTSELYLEAAPLFARKIISIPDHPKLASQLRDLERVTGNSGRDQVRHPKHGHDDFSNVIAGAARQVQRPSLKVIVQAVRGGLNHAPRSSPAYRGATSHKGDTSHAKCFHAAKYRTTRADRFDNTEHFCPAPSPSINELAIGEFDANDSLLASAYQALKSCRVTGESVTTACRAVHADTTLSEGARHVSANDVANKVIARPLPLVDAAGSKIGAEIVRIETKIKQPAIDNTIRACQIATELRLFLRDSTESARRATIMKSLESGDDQIMSAVLSAPPCLSGLSQQESDGFALMLRTKRFPAELKGIARLEKVVKALHLGGQLLISHGQKMAAPAIVASARAFQKTTADAIKAATGAQ